ncbi:MAG: radical SAM protein [Anaerovoracaceae bacterium]
MGRVKEAKEKCLSGQPLSKEEIISLLEIPLASQEDVELRKVARQVASIVTKDRGYIWTAIGADFAPCPLNCQFCSLGEKWGITTETRTYSEKEILTKVEQFVKNGSDFIVLRTTEYYDVNKLGSLTQEIRKRFPGNYKIIFNTGELDEKKSNKLYGLGVNGIYHALRLREGIDTPFDPAVRTGSMESVCNSQLDLISLVEPIGPEHTNEEIADNFLGILKAKAYISGAMARVPVKGTPLGDTQPLDSSRLAQIIAVIRLSGGRLVENICVHPNSKEAVDSGANVVVVETGAIPRSDEIVQDEWSDFQMKDARDLFLSAGYNLSQE